MGRKLISMFHVIILAGENEVSQLSEAYADTVKYLLPVGNVPMIVRTVSMLENEGVEELSIAVAKPYKAEISAALCACKTIQCHVDFILLPPDVSFSIQNVLKYSELETTKDVLIINGDFFGDFDFFSLLTLFLKTDSSLIVSFCKSAFRDVRSKLYCPEEEEIIMIDLETQQLLEKIPKSHTEEEGMILKRSVGSRHPKASLSMSLTDVGIYLLTASVVDLLINLEPQPITFDFAHYVLHKALSSEKFEFLNEYEQMRARMLDGFLGLDNLLDENSENERPRTKPFKVLANVDKGSCFRIIDYYTFLEANKQIIKDVIIGENATISNRQEIKKSVIGANCVVEENVKIINSVIFDNVVIKKRVTIIGSIISSNCFVESNTIIRDSFIFSGQHLPPSCKLEGSIVMEQSDFGL